MRDIQQKISFSKLKVKEALDIMELATPGSNKEKDAKKQLHKHRVLLLKYQSIKKHQAISA